MKEQLNVKIDRKILKALRIFSNLGEQSQVDVVEEALTAHMDGHKVWDKLPDAVPIRSIKTEKEEARDTIVSGITGELVWFAERCDISGPEPRMLRELAQRLLQLMGWRWNTLYRLRREHGNSTIQEINAQRREAEAEMLEMTKDVLSLHPGFSDGIDEAYMDLADVLFRVLCLIVVTVVNEGAINCRFNLAEKNLKVSGVILTDVACVNVGDRMSSRASQVLYKALWLDFMFISKEYLF